MKRLVPVFLAMAFLLGSFLPSEGWALRQDGSGMEFNEDHGRFNNFRGRRHNFRRNHHKRHRHLRNHRFKHKRFGSQHRGFHRDSRW